MTNILYTIYNILQYVFCHGPLYTIYLCIYTEWHWELCLYNCITVCIRCLIPLQRYLISLMLSSRTKQRRQSECKKTTTSTYRQHPFQGRKTDVEKKIEIKRNFCGSEEDIFIKYCIQTLSRRIRGSRKRIEINIGDWNGFYDPNFNNWAEIFSLHLYWILVSISSLRGEYTDLSPWAQPVRSQSDATFGNDLNF